MGEKITGAQSLVYALEAAGATDVFGIPGGHPPAVRPR